MSTADDFLDTETIDARRKRETDEANAEKTFVADLVWIMSSPRGRRFMWWLLSLCGVNRISFNNSGSITAFNEGQRNVGLAVQAKVSEHCHGSYLTMLDEQRKQ